jgi:hypothetical protein
LFDIELTVNDHPTGERGAAEERELPKYARQASSSDSGSMIGVCSAQISRICWETAL